MRNKKRAGEARYIAKTSLTYIQEAQQELKAVDVICFIGAKYSSYTRSCSIFFKRSAATAIHSALLSVNGLPGPSLKPLA